MSKTVTLSSIPNDYRKWETIRIAGTNQTGVIIKTTPFPGMVNMTVYPYKHPRNRLMRILKFKWLKLRVWLKIVK